MKKDSITIQRSRNLKRLLFIQLVATFLIFGLGAISIKQSVHVHGGGMPFLATVLQSFSILLLALIAYKFCNKNLLTLIGIPTALLMFDVFLITKMVHYTGGIDSLYSSLYLLLIIAAGLVVSRNACLQITALTTVFFIVLVGLESSQTLWNSTLDMRSYDDRLYLWYVLFLKTGLYLFTGGLTYYFVRELDKKESKLVGLTKLHDSVIHNMKTGMVILNQKYEIITANPAALSIFHTSWDEINGKNILTLFEGTNREKLGYIFSEDLHRVGFTRNYELTFVNHQQESAIGFNISLLQEDNDQLIGYVMLFQDISMKKKFEEEIMRIERHNALGEMAVMIAHELRNPLASLTGSVEVLKEKLAPGNQSQKLFDVIIKESRRLNKIVTDFLDMARVSLPQIGTVDIQELVDEVILILQHHEKVPLHLSFVKKIPPCTKVLGDSDQLKQVLNNLIFNGIEASMETQDHGVIRLCISAEKVIRAGKAYISINVQDFGKGLTDEEQHKICRPFYSSKKEGTGLGLTVVQNIVKQHDGALRIESEPGKGATFRVLLVAA